MLSKKLSKGGEMNKKQLIGSKTAKGGFANEKYICEKFNNWETDHDAQKWLNIMGYSVSTIAKLQAIQIPVRIAKKDYEKFHLSPQEYEETVKFKKADAQIQLTIKINDIICVENISIKKANKNTNFNQIDKRPISTYQIIWNFNDVIAKWLKLFTGELNPANYIHELEQKTPSDPRRLFMHEIPKQYADMIIDFFTENKTKIISDILRGRGSFSAEWVLVTMYDQSNDETQWNLVNINSVIGHYAKGDVEMTPRGSIKIGKITLQRKGGTPDPTSLQFKFKPLDIFDL